MGAGIGDTDGAGASRKFPPTDADATEAERLRAARAAIEALRRSRAGVPATSDRGLPAPVTPAPTAPVPRAPAPAALSASASPKVAGAATADAPDRSRRLRVRPRGLAPRTGRARARGGALLVAGVLTGAVAGYLVGRAGVPADGSAPARPAPSEASMRARIDELEAETGALQRELLRLELDAVASAAAEPPADEAPAGDAPPVEPFDSGGVDAPAPEAAAVALDVPAEDTVENRTYGPVAGPPGPEDGVLP